MCFSIEVLMTYLDNINNLSEEAIDMEKRQVSNESYIYDHIITIQYLFITRNMKWKSNNPFLFEICII